MHSLKRQTPTTARLKLVAAACFVFGAATFAQGSDRTHTNAVRHLKDNTIFSSKSPKANLSVSKGFRFIGTQRVDLHGKAEAEQYLFARSNRSNIVERFYLLQFEKFLPTNNLTYDYASMSTMRVHNFQFKYDVKRFNDFASLLMEDAGSDGAAMKGLFAKRHLSLPDSIVIVRMFHLPSADHRTELMIVYGEALPRNSVARGRAGGVQLDAESPSSAQRFVEHARQGLFLQGR